MGEAIGEIGHRRIAETLGHLTNGKALLTQHHGGFFKSEQPDIFVWRHGCGGFEPAIEGATAHIHVICHGLKKGTKEFRPFNPESVVIPSNKAYLKFSGGGSARLVISFDEDPTAINAVEAADAKVEGLKDGKYFEDGKIVIELSHRTGDPSKKWWSHHEFR